MKKKDINILHINLMLFVFIVPLVASAFEKTIAVYISLGLFSIAVGYRVFKSGVIVLTKSSVFLFMVAAYSFLQMLWVSDKGSQFALGAMMLAASLASCVIADYKKQIGSENFKSTAVRLVYLAALFYTVMAILHQIFIESKFLFCSMSFGSGSSATSAFIAVVGIMAAMKLFRKNMKQAGFYVAVPLMGYMLIMSKSVLGYLFAALVAFAWAITHKHKKAEALICLIVSLVLGVINVISALAILFTNPLYFNGAVKGLVSIFGVGSGGYNAVAAITDKGYEGFAITINYMLEAYGAIGLGIVVLTIAAGVLCYRREKRFEHLLMIFFTMGVLMSSSATLVFTLPVIGMYYANCEDGVTVYTNRIASAVAVVPIIFSLLFTLAHVPYGLAQHQCDLGNYQKGGAYYAVGASMEIFNAHGWEMAYEAYSKSGDEALYEEQKEIIDKAVKFNKKNYTYHRDLANVYSAEGDYIKALEIWSDIIVRHDKEYLYPMYAQKIVDVMANCPLGLEKTEELFERLGTYTKKATQKDIVFEMNNLLTKSQQYYVNARESGQTTAEDWYSVEDTREEAHESSNTES